MHYSSLIFDSEVLEACVLLSAPKLTPALHRLLTEVIPNLEQANKRQTSQKQDFQDQKVHGLMSRPHLFV